MRHGLIGLLLVAFGVALAGCVGDSDDGAAAATADPDEGETFVGTVTSALGGTVQTKSGGAMIQVPPDSLDQDTEISVAVEPKESKTAANVYDFGPDGTTFTKAATIEIAYDGNPGKNKKAVLAVKQGAEWIEVSGSKVSSDTISGKVSHFTRFSIIIVDDEVRMEASCEGAPSTFEPCGEADGTLAGSTFAFQDMCMQGSMMMDNPMQGMCDGVTVGADVEISGTVDFGADGMMTERMGDVTATSTINIPLDCLSTEMGGISCDQLSSSMGSQSMDGDMQMRCVQSGGYCACSGTTSESMGPVDSISDPMPYEVSGNQLIITDSDGFQDAINFCLRGDTLMVEPPQEADLTMSGYMILTRQ